MAFNITPTPLYPFRLRQKDCLHSQVRGNEICSFVSFFLPLLQLCIQTSDKSLGAVREQRGSRTITAPKQHRSHTQECPKTHSDSSFPISVFSPLTAASCLRASQRRRLPLSSSSTPTVPNIHAQFLAGHLCTSDAVSPLSEAIFKHRELAPATCLHGWLI